MNICSVFTGFTTTSAKKGVHDLKRATLQLLSGQFVIEVLHSSSFKRSYTSMPLQDNWGAPVFK